MKIITLLITLLLSGCWVDHKEIEQAEMLCRKNGGLKNIDNTLSLTTQCKNGAFFDVERN